MVSIVIPIYNVEKYIEQCIKSVINQTYQDLEVILVDDDSPDNSMQLAIKTIETFGQTSKIKFVIINHKRNKGLSAARNTGTMQANGDYIFYLDSDDEITPDCITLLMGEVKKHPDVQIVQGEVKSIPKNDYYDMTHLSEFSFIDNNDWVRYRLFKDTKRLPINAWNKLIQKDFIIKNKLYFKDGIIHEDELWMINVVKKLQRIAFCHHITYIHYKRPGSIMVSTSKKESAKNMAIVIDEALSNLDKYNHKQQYDYCLNLFAHRHIYLSKPSYKKLHSHFQKIALQKGYVKRLVLLYLVMLSRKIGKGYHTVETMISNLK